MVPFWVPTIIRHRIFRVPQKGTIILTTTHVLVQRVFLKRGNGILRLHESSPSRLGSRFGAGGFGIYDYLVHIWGFPKIRGTFLGALIIRTIVYWGGSILGFPNFGKLPFQGTGPLG